MIVKTGFLLGTLMFCAGLYAQMPDDIKVDSSKWRSYETKEPKSAITVEAPDIIKIKTPGTNKVEGTGLDIKVAPLNRYEMSCRAKGEGKIMLCVCKKGGWVYGDKIPLTADWQDLKVQFYTEGESITPSILTFNEKPQASSFEVSEFSIKKTALSDEMPKMEIEPLFFEAENYPAKGAAGKIIEDSDAIGGACVEGKRYYTLAENIPLPQTGLPFYIYLRANAGSVNMKNLLLSVRPSGTYFETFSDIRLPSEGKWIWVKTEALNYKIGKSFSVSANGSDANAAMKFDAIIISTRCDLAETDFNKISGGK